MPPTVLTDPASAEPRKGKQPGRRPANACNSRMA